MAKVTDLKDLKKGDTIKLISINGLAMTSFHKVIFQELVNKPDGTTSLRFKESPRKRQTLLARLDREIMVFDEATPIVSDWEIHPNGLTIATGNACFNLALQDDFKFKYQPDGADKLKKIILLENLNKGFDKYNRINYVYLNPDESKEHTSDKCTVYEHIEFTTDDMNRILKTDKAPEETTTPTAPEVQAQPEPKQEEEFSLFPVN